MLRLARWAAPAGILLFGGLLVRHVVTDGGTLKDPLVPQVLIALVASAIVAVVTLEPIWRLIRPGPKLVGGEFVDVKRSSVSGRDIQVIGVQIYNERESGDEPTTARAVVAELEAFDLSGDSIKRTKGVWFADRDGNPRDTMDFRPVRVEQHPVELVGKFPEDANAYVAGELDPPSLKPGDYRIRVTLRGGNVRKPARLDFYVRNPGAGKLLTAARKAADLEDGAAVPAAPVAAATAASASGTVTAVTMSRVVTPPPAAPSPASAKLDMYMTKRQSGTHTLTIANVGSVDIERIEWILPEGLPNWHFFQDSLAAYPIPVLEAGDSLDVLVAVTFGGPVTIEVTFRGWVGDAEYTRRRTLSIT